MEGGALRSLTRALPWAVIESVGTVALTVALVLVTAHVLEPQHFGVVALGQAVAQLAQLVACMGLGEAVIQRRDLAPQHLDSAFWALLVLGITGFGLSSAAASCLAALYGWPDLVTIMVVQATGCIFAATNAIPLAMLGRAFHMRSLALRSLLAIAAQLAATSLLAWSGFGIWSVVLGGLAQNIVGSALLWRAYAKRPRLRFCRRHLAELFRFGLPTMLEALTWIAAIRAFEILVGVLHGLAALGYFSFALRTTDTVASILTGITGRLALPFLARLQDDPHRLRDAFAFGTRAIAAISTPVFAGLLLTAPDWVPIVFGQKWAPAVPLVQIMSGVWIIVLGRTLVAPCLKALGRPDAILIPGLAGCATMLVAAAATADLGIAEAAGAWASRAAIVLPISLVLMARIAGMPIRDQLAPLAPALLSAGLMAAVLLVWRSLAGDLPPALLLASSAAIGALVYMTALRLMDPRLVASWREARETGGNWTAETLGSGIRQ